MCTYIYIQIDKYVQTYRHTYIMYRDPNFRPAWLTIDPKQCGHRQNAAGLIRDTSRGEGRRRCTREGRQVVVDQWVEIGLPKKKGFNVWKLGDFMVV